MFLRFAFFMVLLLPLAANSELIVVADLGGEPAAPWYEAISPEPMTSPQESSPKPFQEEDLLPIVTGNMQPGLLKRRPLSLIGMSPIFLIGDDVLSKQWLSEQRSRLQSLDATGLVVNVADIERLEELREIAGELTLLPVSGEDLATRLQLTTYPVLITETGLEQ
jgi:integrating conjugative element protein (TIGR03765 family)